MCRLVAHLGRARALDSLLFAPAHSLEHQSYAPNEQRHGTMNADGWGVGWYDLDHRPEPARYRTPRPLWADGSMRSMAGLLASTCIVAIVRSATAPSIVDEANTPPFTSGPWLMAHNGAVPGWRDGINEQVRRRLTPRRAGAIEGSTDSETLFALALDHLDRDADPGAALAEVVAAIAPLAPEARLNLVLTDGVRLAAAVWGDTLYRAATDDGTLLASEPLDTVQPWERLPDRSLVLVDADGASTRPLDPPS